MCSNHLCTQKSRDKSVANFRRYLWVCLVDGWEGGGDYNDEIVMCSFTIVYVVNTYSITSSRTFLSKYNLSAIKLNRD